MKKKILIICAVMVAVVGLAFLFGTMTSNQPNNADSVLAPSDDNGNIPEKIIGDAETAKVIVYEYADYGCSHCAQWNKKIKEIIEEADGEMAVVFRGYDIGFNNGNRAAQAATAAQLQGCWEPYKDLLFAGQSEWMYAEADDVDDIFVEYFKTASNDEGDVDKFRADMDSLAVNKRVQFENNLGDRVNLKGTPMFRIDGRKIELSNLVETIMNKLNGGN